MTSSILPNYSLKAHIFTTNKNNQSLLRKKNKSANSICILVSQIYIDEKTFPFSIKEKLLLIVANLLNFIKITPKFDITFLDHYR